MLWSVFVGDKCVPCGFRGEDRVGGLMGVAPRMAVRDNYALSMIYTPGVAEPCLEIARESELSYRYTWRGNAMAVMGGEVAWLPRLERAAAALKVLAGIDAVPLVVAARRPGDLVRVVGRTVSTFGGVWLLGFKGGEAGRAMEELGEIGVPVIPPPRDGEHCLADLSVFPGLMRAMLDLRVKRLEAVLVAEAVKAGDELELSFGSAVRVARAVAEKAIEMGLSGSGVTAGAVEARLAEYLETGRLRPLVNVDDWVEAVSARECALRLHAALGGTLEMKPSVQPRDPARLRAVLEGAERASSAIAEDPKLADRLTCRGNMVAVVTDGSAVLGLGDIGAGAGLPVMLGKCVLFKTLGGCDAVPVCIDSRDTREIVDIVEALAPSFGGINLEDISAPRCFEIEEELKKRVDVFVFHDDQHGTAVVTLAGLINAAKLAGKTLGELTVTFNGAGAAGIAVTKLLMAAGVEDVILCDRSGPIYEGRPEHMNGSKTEIARLTNRGLVKGTLADAVRGRDVFIGLSGPGVLTAGMVRTMAKSPIVFAMANPVPEILPGEALAAGAAAVATGRSDFANQINNCLGFPGIFRGALDVRARSINDGMKLAAAEAIAGLVEEGRLGRDYFIPSALDLRVAPAVASAIAKAAMETGEARAEADPAQIARRTKRLLYEGG